MLQNQTRIYEKVNHDVENLEYLEEQLQKSIKVQQYCSGQLKISTAGYIEESELTPEDMKILYIERTLRMMELIVSKIDKECTRLATNGWPDARIADQHYYALQIKQKIYHLLKARKEKKL